MNRTLMINYTNLKNKIATHTHTHNDVRIHFTFISFIKVKAT
jgi:hypothetical protein